AENARRTALILGAVETRREEMGAPISPINRARYERTVQEARAILGQAVFALSWKSGRAMTFEQTAMLALKEEQEVIGHGSGISDSMATDPYSPIPDPFSLSGLTEREIEVLHLLATGLTNREIAEQLVLSHRTVQSHLYNIFNKLGVTTRSAATRLAVDNGLA
ncbi:MAG: response regulator transcription factor, partial [Chloroflexia bacterium]